jgi:hypothetical protein
LALDREQVVQYLESLDKETKAVKREALRFCWYMRGGLSYEEAIMLSQTERQIIGDIIKDNMETTKESGMPFF